MESNNIIIIFCYAKFNWQILFTKPFRYLIQLFTGKYCHCAISLNNYVAEVTGKGVRKIKEKEWLIDYRDNDSIKIEKFTFLKPLFPDQIETMNKFIDNNIGVEYSILEALISPIDNEYFHYNNQEKTFCAEFVRDCLVAIKMLKAKKYNIKTDPNEFYRELRKEQLIERRGVIYV